MGLIYKTNSWKGYGKQNTYHNEYFDDGDIIRKVKVHLFKLFDGRENSWEREKKRWRRPGLATTPTCLIG